MRLTIAILIFLVFFIVSIHSQYNIDHTIWDRLLKDHVSDDELNGIKLNVVDYEGVKNDKNFDAYIDQLSQINFNATVTNQDIYALFINAYNAFVMKILIDNPCHFDIFGKCLIRSITQIGTPVVDPVWKKRVFNFGGEKWSLDDVEYFIRGVEMSPDGQVYQDNYPSNHPRGIRAEDLDFRLHAAVVCGSISCPNLRRGAYFPETLDSDLTENFNDFIQNKQKGLKIQGGQITLSRIFFWYKTDFEKSYIVRNKTDNVVLRFIHHYTTDATLRKALESKFDVDFQYLQFFNYDWDMNSEQGKQIPCGSSDRKCMTVMQYGIVGIVFFGGGFGLCCICCVTCCLCCLFVALGINSRRKRRSRYIGIQ